MKSLRVKSGRRSMALVVTLVLVTLTSALVVAFVMRARLDLAASSSYAGVPQADGIGRGGVEFIVGWLRREIQEGSEGYDENGDPVAGADAIVFKPLAPANLLPQRTATRGGGGAYQSLVRMSRSGEPFYAPSDGWQFNGAASFDMVSDVSTADGSANGRRFGGGRWATPGLLTSDEAAEFNPGSGGSGAGQGVVPDWVYVTRRGPERVTETDEAQRDDNPENLDYVLGRFAYAVYDISGLLDVGVAGYPGELGDHGVQSKGSLAFADPGAMTLPNGAAVDREGLVAWRNRATGTDFMGYVTNAVKEGFRTNAVGDNGFFGRGDLVGFARAAATRQVFDTNALPYLTSFSRERAAPSWWPTIPEALEGKVDVEYEKEAFEKGRTNRWASAVMAQSDFTAPDGTEFKVGEPLLKRRFPLSRINMLRADSGASAQDIWYYFGLVKSGEAGRGSGIPLWVYNPKSAVPQEQERILYTLDQVAAGGQREPNFFELLAAGILHGSVAKSGYREGMDLRLGRDRSAYHQILQIGANIIDQYDTDSDPTIIRSLSDEAIKQGYNQTVNLLASTIRGIENLPYIDEFLTTWMRDRTKPPPNNEWVQAPITLGDTSKQNKYPFVTYFLQFELWNPHRNALEAPEGRYRVIAQMGQTYLDYRAYIAGAHKNTGGGSPDPREYNTQAGGAGGTQVTYNDIFQEQVRQLYPPTRYGRNFASSPCTMEFSAGGGNALFDTPRMLQFDDSDLKMKVGNALDTFTAGQARITGLRLGDVLCVNNLDLDENPNNDFEWFHWEEGLWKHRDNHINPYFQASQPLVVELQKQSASGGWFTYQVFAPKKSGSQLAGVPGFDQSAQSWGEISYHSRIYARRWPVAHSFNPVSDPRCQRFGFTHGGGVAGGNYEYEKCVGATVRDISTRLSPHVNKKNFFGKEGDGTRLTEAGWQFPAWIAPYSADPAAADWTSSANKINIDKDHLWFWWKQDILRYQTAVAEFAENNDGEGRMGGPISMMFARDPDGLVRRGDGWRGRKVDPYSMEMEPVQNVGRPVFLNRPFQSVGELGYVLRDDPWKTLNLFWGDSADAGLLDLFCLEEGETFRPVRAGVVNPNTAPREVLAAVLAGTALHGKVGATEPPRLDSAGAAQIADAIRTYLGPRENPTRVLRTMGDIGEMCEEIFETGGAQAALGDMKDTDVGREAVARSLADVCNTRTWNLFIDVVAQAGRFTAASRTPQDFMVRAERRLWVHLALDRITGELVDIDIEPVFE